MPDRSEKVLRRNEETGQYELPYISKSRVMQWKKNPEHFRLKYLEGIREPETDAMVRGTRIHETFEEYYLSAAEAGQPRDRIELLPDDRQLWADFIEPYVTNFFKWEQRRADEVDGVAEHYLPIAVEDEHWRSAVLDLPGEPEWMGLADAIIPAQSVSQVNANSGVVIVDFKTGKVPDKKYRSNGIYTELEYYEILFEDKYDVAGAAAYYPREDTLLVQPNNQEYRSKVLDAAREMVEACNDYNGDAQFEAKEGPLCKWGMDDDQESAFYGVCSQCTWGVPAKNPETFEHYVENGYSNFDIAEAMGTTEDAVSYWKYKMDL